MRAFESAAVAALRRLAPRPGPLLLAVSGGVDSMAMLEALGRGAPAAGYPVWVGHIHHGLRGDEADADAAFVRDQASERGLPFATERVDPAGAVRAARSSRERPTLQEAARSVRYAALAKLAARIGADQHCACVIATAHTADDQAETVLLRLLRGCGPDGLTGIPPRSPDGGVVRPLLGFERAEIERYARGRRLAWREDASNRDLRFARNRLRRRHLPALAEDFNPRVLRSLAQLAEAQRRDSEWLGRLVTDEATRRWRAGAAGRAGRLETGDWETLPESLRRRLLRWIWVGLGGGRDVAGSHLARLDAFAAGGPSGRVLELPGGIRVRRSPGVLEWSASG